MRPESSVPFFSHVFTLPEKSLPLKYTLFDGISLNRLNRCVSVMIGYSSLVILSGCMSVISSNTIYHASLVSTLGGGKTPTCSKQDSHRASAFVTLSSDVVGFPLSFRLYASSTRTSVYSCACFTCFPTLNS